MNKDKKLAIFLRRRGHSYSEINKKIGISKSTLSYWLKDISLPLGINNEILFRTKKNRARNITEYNRQRARLIWQKRETVKNEYSKQIDKLSAKELKLIGISLYWAEGDKKSKWTIMFCNADANLVKIMMRFFREICKIPENKFKPSIQIHDQQKSKIAEKYWSKVSRIPIKQFNKTVVQISSASKLKRPKNSLPHGTFRVYIFNARLVDKINGWIQGLAKQEK